MGFAAFIAVALPAAQAQYAFSTKNAKLREARAAFEKGEYAATLELTDAARSEKTNLEENMEIYRLRSMSNALLDKHPQAVNGFKRLLAMDPDHRLGPEPDPRITKAFEKARAFWKGKVGGIVIDHDGVSAPAAGKALRVIARITDPLDMIEHASIFYRDSPTDTFKEVHVDRRPGATRFEWDIPGEDVRAGMEIEYYLEFQDNRSGPVARIGEARAPRRALVPGLPPHLRRSVVEPEDGTKRSKVDGGRAPVALYVLGAGLGAAAIGTVIWLLVPKRVDLDVVSCVAACD